MPEDVAARIDASISRALEGDDEAVAEMRHPTPPVLRRCAPSWSVPKNECDTASVDETLAAEDLANTLFAFADADPPEPGQSPALATGSARYREGRLIGRGGMGRVVEAEDLQFGRKVALETMLGGPEAGERVQRFGLEAIVTANLDHPGIPPVYERGRDSQGNPFYTMRLVRGRNLEQAIAQTQTLDDRLRLLPALIGVAQTLAFAHARGVIHRDIKPENVVVGAFGDTVVIDWGVAKLRGVGRDRVAEVGEPSMVQAIADTSGSTATRDGAVIGTPAYMAPEQAGGRIDELDERSDVFSIGALLYHLFTGRPPYRGKTSLETLSLAIEAEHEPLARVAPEVPAPLVAIVERAMAKDPANRYPSAGALAEALVAVVAEGVRDRGSKAVRLFANATSSILTLIMVLLVAAILVNVSIADLGVFGFLVVPTFVIGAVLAGIEWWTIGRYGLSPLILGLAVVTALEGLVAAAAGRSEIAAALLQANEDQALEPMALGLGYLQGSRLVGAAEIISLQFCAALIVLYAVARYRIGTTAPSR